MSFLQREFQRSLLISYISSTSNLYAVCVEAWVFSTYSTNSLKVSESLSRGVILVPNLRQFESNSFMSLLILPSSSNLVNTWISYSDCSISNLAFTFCSVSSTKFCMRWKPKSCGIYEQKSPLSLLITSARFLPFTSSMSPFRASQPRRILFLANFPRGIFLASYPIYFIWLFIIFMSNISLTRSCTDLSKLDCTSGWSSFFAFSFFSSFFSSFSSASQFISTSLYPPPSLSRNFWLKQRMARSGEAQGISARCPSTPTLPHLVKKMMLLGLDSFCRICRIQNLLLLFWMLDWLRVLAQVTPMCTITLKVAGCEKYWSTGTLPFRITFFISFSSFAAYLAGYLAAGLGGLSSFLVADRSLRVFLGSVFDFFRPLLSASSGLTFLEGESSLSTALSNCLPRVLVLISGSGGAGLSSFLSSLGALLLVLALGGIYTALYFIRIFIIIEFTRPHM